MKFFWDVNNPITLTKWINDKLLFKNKKIIIIYQDTNPKFKEVP